MKGSYIYFFFLVCYLTNHLFIYFLFIFVTVTVKAIKQVFLSFRAAGFSLNVLQT